MNSFDLIKKFEAKDLDSSRPTLLSAKDRNFINANYHHECGALSQRVIQRRGGDEAPAAMKLSEDNSRYYEDKLWPLGVVMYGVEDGLRGTRDHAVLRYAMAFIELSTCVVFEEYKDDVLSPKNLLWFGTDGEEIPMYGFQRGNQTVKLETAVRGAPGHAAHVVASLLRALGVHMMSNRFDRDNYVSVHWRNVQSGKQQLLEKAPPEAWLAKLPYDFDSITHAPANYACQDVCALGGTTVEPLQDHLWQKTISMGHKTEFSESDLHIMKLLYGKQCQSRFVSDSKNKELL